MNDNGSGVAMGAAATGSPMRAVANAHARIPNDRIAALLQIERRAARAV